MKKLSVFIAVLILLTGCAHGGERADGKGRVSENTELPQADTAMNVDVEMYICDGDWEPMSGITAELYAETTEVGWAQPTYSATADGEGRAVLEDVAAGQRYTVEIKGRNGGMAASGAMYVAVGEKTHHTDEDGYIEITVPEGAERVYITLGAKDGVINCSYSSDKGRERAKQIN